ncbi:MlaD family protein [Nocardia sp. NPDC050713]|uniref:MlaD family protein n=1 Tax=Nocardia sp. NPDC050713 TaxID=3154511 RepID=UPI0033F58DFB
MVVLLVAVLQIVSRPVGRETESYTAIFTDANGLKVGDDARMYGVRVGKVTGLKLDGANARIRFTVADDYEIFANTTLAIRYQNLSGQRYLDIRQLPEPSVEHPADEVIGTDQTVPAFDITRLFNGLQPVLAELSPADIDKFATSMLAVIEGDGSGLGPALDAMGKLSEHVKDRQAVISTLVRNLGLIAGDLGGKSTHTMTLVQQLIDLFTALYQKLPGLVEFGEIIPPVLEPVRSLLNTLGLTGDPNPYLDQLIRDAIPDPRRLVETMDRLPGVIQSLAAAVPNSVADTSCAHGAAEAPQPLQVLIRGQRIALCKR